MCLHFHQAAHKMCSFKKYRVMKWAPVHVCINGDHQLHITPDHRRDLTVIQSTLKMKLVPLALADIAAQASTVWQKKCHSSLSI